MTLHGVSLLVFGVLVSAMSLTGSVGTTALAFPLEICKGVVKGPKEPSTFSLPTFVPFVTCGGVSQSGEHGGGSGAQAFW